MKWNMWKAVTDIRQVLKACFRNSRLSTAEAFKSAVASGLSCHNEENKKVSVQDMTALGSMLPKDAIFQYFPHMWCRISPNINFRSSIRSFVFLSFPVVVQQWTPSIVVLFNMHFLWKHRHHQHLSISWSLLWASCMIIRMLRQKISIMHTEIKVGGTIQIYSRPGVLDITLNLVRVAETTLFPNN